MPGFILYSNLLRSATVVSESTLSNFGIANAHDGKTSTEVGFEGGGIDRDIVLDFGASQPLDTIAIARHNLGSLSSANLSLWGSNDNVSFVSLIGLQDLSNVQTNWAHQFPSVSYRFYRLRLTVNGGNAYIADICIGNRFELLRSQKPGFAPPEHTDGDQLIPNVTRGKNLVGISIKQGLQRAKFQLFYYHWFFFVYWRNFKESVKRYPCYIVWTDGAIPFYCWPTKKMPEPKYSKNHNEYLDVTLDMTGFSE